MNDETFNHTEYFKGISIEKDDELRKQLIKKLEKNAGENIMNMNPELLPEKSLLRRKENESKIITEKSQEECFRL